MQHLPESADPNLLVGPEHFSDAGVYRIDDETALVQTVDFFPPIVNDPYAFGQIAAANSLSDVYAMGGSPLTALNIVGFPSSELDMDVLNQILAGGAERIQAAGAVVVGGHSVRDSEVKYGLSVTGTVHPERMMTNMGARPGDVLVLTKALGTGFVTTAHRAGKCPQEVLDSAIESMRTLNCAASAAAVDLGARAATDITGFGVAGHCVELAQASGVTVVVHLSSLPILFGAEELARRGNLTGANNATRAHLESSIRSNDLENHELEKFLFDPQTSGGLAIALAPDLAEELVSRCHEAGLSSTTIIGEVIKRTDVDLIVTE